MVAAAPARSRPASLSRALPAAVDRQAATARESRHDAELVRSFHAGNEAAFTEISVRHRGKLHSIAFGYFHNHADAEDIAQDALIRAHRALPRFRGDSSLATWLHHITVNLSHNRYWYYRRRRRQDTQTLDGEPGPGVTTTLRDLLACGAPDPARVAETVEFSRLALSGLERLEGSQREILRLRVVLDRSYEQIAAVLGIRVGTVKSRIARARESLRALLAESYPEATPRAPFGRWFGPARPLASQRSTPVPA